VNKSVWIGSHSVNNLKSKIQNRKLVRSVALVTLVMCGAVAQAQQLAKVPRIGLLVPGTQSAFSIRTDAFRQGLRELGYVEGQNIVIEYRYTDGKADRLPDLATELVGLKVDVIVTASIPPVLAAKKASSPTPIVFAAVNDPVAAGLVDSLAHPGGNITGLTNLSPDLDGKRLELLKEAFPKLTRVAYLWNPDAPGTGLAGMQAAASGLGVQLQSLEARSANDFDSAFEAALRERAHALITLPSPVFITHQKRIVEFAAKNRLPAIYSFSDFVDAGGLMSYAPSLLENWRRAAIFVDKILKGTKPADLPVEQPKKFEFIINLKTAKQIGLTIPPNVLARADRVIR
jgi:putative tryptophan/tyrosine transport system substrate-binding protein